MKKKPLIGVGMEVYFKAHVFGFPFAPFYDKYAGHKFRVVRFGSNRRDEDPDAVALECIDDPTIIVEGNIHPADLKQA